MEKPHAEDRPGTLAAGKRPVDAVPVAPMETPVDADAVALPFDGARPDMPPERWFRLHGLATARNIDRPTLTPMLPAGPATGAAVVIAPGGGYLISSVENEGWAQARWLAERGIAAFVLRYRLEPTAADDAAFTRALIARFAAAASGETMAVPRYMVDDARAALAMVRARGGEWSVDPARVGYLGFSAGAMIGLELATTTPVEERPAFLAAVYSSMAERAVPPDAPPLFAAIAIDDPLYGRQGFGLVDGWRRAGASTELHVYSGGGHGFGMGKPGTTSTGLMTALHGWLDCGGWLGTAR